MKKSVCSKERRVMRSLRTIILLAGWALSMKDPGPLGPLEQGRKSSAPLPGDAYGWITAQGGSIEYLGARLDIPPGALASSLLISMEALDAELVPGLDTAMDNVTAPFAGLRLGPDGTRFQHAATLTLPYDPDKMPAGTRPEDIHTFYFDPALERWIPLERVAVDPVAHTIVSLTDHFTDVINGTLTVPDHPRGENFAPNSISDLDLADPGASIGFIDAPTGGPMGDAQLDFAIEVPPGRRGLQPALAVTYSSDGGNGWLGMGWDLAMPSIQVDTAFGVPRYDTRLETETYLLNGEFLAPVANLVSPTRRQADRVFVRRVEGSFERIIRKGNEPDNYWWEVTSQDGTRFIYGQSAAARLQDYQAPHNTFRWNLERVIDVHGNTIDYSYELDTGQAGEPWVQSYPSRIDYTGRDGKDAYYQIKLVRDSGDRGDRMSSGLAGFKTLTRFRLDHVDVLAGGELVRRYNFHYKVGGFQKSLLEAVAVAGEDGVTELYRHSFEYNTVPMRGDDEIDGFTPQETWTGMSSSDDASHTESFAAGVQSFTGFGPPGCEPHAGLQVGGGGGATSTVRSFLDVNGDGLPDRIDRDGDVALNRFDPETGQGSFEPSTMPGTGLLAHTRDMHFDLGLGAHALGELANLGTAWVWSHANDDRAIADVNGDGWPDLVNTQGSFDVQLNDLGTRFAPPTPWQGFSFEGIDLTVPEESSEVLENFDLSNALRKLRLPFAGRIALTGAVQKTYAGGQDGVEASIYHNDTRVWKRFFAPADTASCAPGPDDSCSGGLILDVAAGDRLYFMADSIAETSADALSWAPNATYQGRDADAREPYGARIFVFDAAADFRLAGSPGGQWVAPATGTVRVIGDIGKQATSDDVVVTITRTRGDESTVLYTRTLPAAQTGSIGDFPTIDVSERDMLSFHIASDSQIDPDRVAWTPKVSYQGNPPLPPELITQPVQVLTDVHGLLPADVPTTFWTAPAPDTYKVDVTWTATSPSTEPVLLYVQSTNQLIAKKTVPTGSSTFPFSVDAALAQGQALYVTSLSSRASSVGTLVASIAGQSIPTNSRYRDDRGDVLSGGYHGFFYGEWNGDVPFHEPGMPDNAARLADDAAPFVPAMPLWQGDGNVPGPLWRAAGFDLYIAAQGEKPSRRGGNVVVELGVAAGTSGQGPQIVRKTYGRTSSKDIGLGITTSLSEGFNITQIDLMDMNGDRYPDQVSEGRVRLSNGNGAFGELRDVPGLDHELRRTEDGNFNVGVGLGITFSKKDGKGKSREVLSTMPSVGSTTSLSQPRTDLLDVNGDGLPDRVRMTPNTDAMMVQLNLGYRFGAEESWPLPQWATRDLCDEFLPIPPGLLPELDTPDAMSLTQSTTYNAGLAIGPIGGGVGTTLARTVVDFADINGDGLVDHLFKDQGEDFFRVKLNLGDGWSSEQRWHVPPWETSIGGIYNPLDMFQCLDAVSLNGAINGSGSVGAPICVPLVPPIVVAGLQIEISAQASGGTGGLQLFFEDMDGDGLADHALKKGGDPNMYLKRNKVTQANLLSKVVRPLGGSFTLTYERQGNRVDYSDPAHRIDMPANQWVLAATILLDGQGNQYETRFDYFDDAFYDRAERAGYGYARVRTTLADGSTSDRYFHNQDFYRKTLAYRTERRDAQGRLFLMESVDYELRDVAPGSFFPARVDETVFFYEGTTTNPDAYRKSTRRTFAYDRLGNITRYEDFADEGPEDNAIALIEYDMNPALFVIRPAHIEVTDYQGKMLRERHGFYTSLGDLERLEQILTGGRDPATGKEYEDARVITRMTYDDRGNLATLGDPGGYTLTYTYDEDTHTHVTGIVDSFGYTTGYEYDLKYAVRTATTDQNGNTSRQSYDQFGRLIEVVAPGDPGPEPTIWIEYEPEARPPYAITHNKDVMHPGDPISAVVFTNGLGQVIQGKRDAQVDTDQGPRVGMQVTGKLVFDVMGRIAQQGQPAFSTAPLHDFVDVPLTNPMSFEYDILDRVLRMVFAQGTETRFQYGFAQLDGVERLARERIDALGRKTRFYLDVIGPVLGIEQTHTQGDDTVSLITRYGYGPLRSVRSITDPRGNRTEVAYDTLGRRIAIDNPDRGRDEFQYDLASNLAVWTTSNLRARGQEIRYFYTYNRLDRIDYPDTPDVLYTYGEPGAPDNRANRIATITDESGFEERSYSELGQVIKTAKTANTIKGKDPIGPFVTELTHDSFDRLLGIVYPDGEELTYAFDAGGQVTSATGVLRGETYVYVAFMGYDEFGELVRLVYGNGIEERRTYDPRSRFLAGASATGGPAGRFQNLTFHYDDVGSIRRIANEVEVPPPSMFGGPTVQTFEYDDLYRLTRASGQFQAPPNQRSRYEMSLTYDEIGNIRSKQQVHTIQHGSSPPIVQKKTTYDWTYEYQGSHPHAATRIGDRAFDYDLDGNQLGWASDHTGQRRHITWSSANRITSVADQGQTTSFLYNFEGQRTNKQGQGGEIVYVNSYFSVRNSAIGSKQFFVDERRIATRIAQPGGTPGSGHGPGHERADDDGGEPVEQKLFFYHPDQLSSTHFVTDKDGKIFQHFEYFPVGELWVAEQSSTLDPSFLFAGKELDSPTELYYFGARYLDPRQSQWLSPDPIYDGMLDVDALTRPGLDVLPFRLPGQMYAYAGSDPVNLQDPTGLITWRDIFCCCCRGGSQDEIEEQPDPTPPDEPTVEGNPFVFDVRNAHILVRRNAQATQESEITFWEDKSDPSVLLIDYPAAEESHQGWGPVLFYLAALKAQELGKTTIEVHTVLEGALGQYERVGFAEMPDSRNDMSARTADVLNQAGELAQEYGWRLPASTNEAIRLPDLEGRRRD